MKLLLLLSNFFDICCWIFLRLRNAGIPLQAPVLLPTLTPGRHAMFPMDRWSNDWALHEFTALESPPLDPAIELRNWMNMHFSLSNGIDAKEFSSFWERDLARLRSDPRVAQLRVNKDCVLIKTVRATTHIDERKYRHEVFIAAWGIVIKMTNKENGRVGARVNIHYVESGRQDGKSPQYVQTSGFGFCFGPRLTHIQELLAGGSLAETVFAMFESLWHINTTNEHLVLKEHIVLKSFKRRKK